MDQLIKTVLTVLGASDPYTFRHSLRVTESAVMKSEEVDLPEERFHLIHDTAYLRDIDKAGIPNRELNKAGASPLKK